ncbi:MAG: N-acetylneuraminate synthase [Lachnospiraceae bacterium]|nr:N-acetylneuraminate synthase [Lachnospiraceae bacterium]
MERILIIAEAGVNHNGDIQTAKKLIDAAAAAGADAVKFQTFKTENLVCRNAQKAAYQMETTNAGESQFDMLKKLELTPPMHKELISHCKKKSIMFLSTPFDVDSLHYLIDTGLAVIKIPSGEITNYPLLREAAKSGRRIILSSGMSTIEEVREAVAVLKKNGSTDITVLHCNTEYPTPFRDVNLKAMGTIKEEIGVSVGYSDHTPGIEAAVAAAALGAVEQALGDGEKKASESEKKNMAIARKSIVAGCDIKAGDKFTEDNLTAKRPGTGLSPMLWNQVIGQTAKRDFAADEMIEL